MKTERRLAFSMQYANQLWQADTMFGPHIGGRQAKLIAFIDDASRVLCHGEFFFEENVDSMVHGPFAVHSTNAVFPSSCWWTMDRFTVAKKSR